MFAKTRRRLERIEAALEEIKDALGGLGDAVNLKTPGGLSVVAAHAADAKTAAESAFVGMQTLASQATAKPGLPEVVKAVSAHTDALKSIEAAVRTATGPQPALKDPEPAPKPAAGPGAGMGARVPPKGKM
jgi:hypothetical protein